MSKSLGNFRTVRELLQHYPGEVIRYALLAGHYRKPLDFSLTALDQARAALDKLYGTLLPFSGQATTTTSCQAEAAGTVEAALADDLNTPLALACCMKPPAHCANARSPPNNHTCLPCCAMAPHCSACCSRTRHLAHRCPA